MKMKKAFLIILLFVFALPSLTSAQEKETQKGRYSFGVGAGLYNPFLTYFNEGPKTKDWTNKFKAAPLYAANFELDIYKNVRLRVEGSMWSQTAKNTSISEANGGGFQQLDLSLIPVTGTLLFNILPNDRVQAYIGVGAGTVFINSKYTRVISATADTASVKAVSQQVSGRSPIFSIVQGLDIPIIGGLRLGLEARFVFGDYTQDFNGKPSQSISLQGVQGLASLNYAFGK